MLDISFGIWVGLSAMRAMLWRWIYFSGSGREEGHENGSLMLVMFLGTKAWSFAAVRLR